MVVEIESHRKELKIIVRDEGSGIPSKDIQHIFEAHYRAENSAQGTRTNSGLGLAITRRIIELHQSKIIVESVLGEGSAFSFELKRPFV